MAGNLTPCQPLAFWVNLLVYMGRGQRGAPLWQALFIPPSLRDPSVILFPHLSGIPVYLTPGARRAQTAAALAPRSTPDFPNCILKSTCCGFGQTPAGCEVLSPLHTSFT